MAVQKAAGTLKILWKSHEDPPLKDKIMKNIHRWSRRPSRAPDKRCAVRNIQEKLLPHPLAPRGEVCLISGSCGAASGFEDICPRPEADLDIFLRHALQLHTMIGWVNGDQDAHLANAAKKQTLILNNPVAAKRILSLANWCRAPDIAADLVRPSRGSTNGRY